MKCLREENIRRPFDGQVWIPAKRQKTDVPSNVCLFPVPQQILEKYRGKCSGGKVLPEPSSSFGNKLLKKTR